MVTKQYDSLPLSVNFRLSSYENLMLEGIIDGSKLSRFNELLGCESDHFAHVKVAFKKDDLGQFILDMAVTMDCDVICFRCNHVTQLAINSHVLFIGVWSEEQASSVPNDYIPLLMDDELINLHDLVEDELIVSLPTAPSHSDPLCYKKYFDNVHLIQTETGPSDLLEEDAKLQKESLKVEKTGNYPFSDLEKILKQGKI